MSIPDYQSLLLPLLKAVADQQIYTLRVLYERLSDEFGLSHDERAELLPSGNQPVIENRIGWAKTYLKKAGLLEYPKRGHVRITERGLSVLQQDYRQLKASDLKQFEEFQSFTSQSNKAGDEAEVLEAITSEQATPTEAIEAAYQRLRTELATEIMAQIKDLSPIFFERLVVDLMIKMGYGGSRKEAGEATKASADGGIDGIIREDRLGLDTIYLQAKRWDNVVGRPEIQKFAGALQGERAKKGVFITTSSFSREARDYVNNVDNKIVLIDGERLTDLMIDFGVGVSTGQVFEVKQLDSDYFSE
ncbi:restriction endonuclease [Salinivibrio sp. VYel6]|uniref:restriction endonuclease n=1 Tax=Salinivibrio sp. VYel6 TaxID=2490493 RepID=UPI00128C433B|nr:restriction endonuclease [Salinivibrio sp. VYel6]MPX97527.1 restriction endonuclease [Salinivibrio sp. VYel6]